MPRAVTDFSGAESNLEGERGIGTQQNNRKDPYTQFSVIDWFRKQTNKKNPKLDKLLSGLHNYLLWDKMEVDSYNCKSYLQESTKICWIAKIKREQWKNVPKRYLYESLKLYEGVFEFLLNINIRNVGGHIVGREVECYEK